MARTFRLRAADETRDEEIKRLVASAQRYESLAKIAERAAAAERSRR